MSLYYIILAIIIIFMNFFLKLELIKQYNIIKFKHRVQNFVQEVKINDQVDNSIYIINLSIDELANLNQ